MLNIRWYGAVGSKSLAQSTQTDTRYNCYIIVYERRSKINLFFSKRISEADFECALTAVAKGSRRSRERSAEAKLVTWAPCNSASFFPPREKANWKSEPFCFFPAREKAIWLTHPNCFFPSLKLSRQETPNSVCEVCEQKV